MPGTTAKKRIASDAADRSRLRAAVVISIVWPSASILWERDGGMWRAKPDFAGGGKPYEPGDSPVFSGSAGRCWPRIGVGFGSRARLIGGGCSGTGPFA